MDSLEGRLRLTKHLYIYILDVFAIDCPDQILSPNLETFDRPMEQLH